MDSDAELALAEVLAACRNEKDGEFLIDRLSSFYSQQGVENQARLNTVLSGWMDSGDPVKADHAIALVARLNIKSLLPKLLSSLLDIRNGKSNLPQYFEQLLVPAIDKLHRC
jgi:hypothetical protein